MHNPDTLSPDTGNLFARELAALGSMFASGYLFLLVL